MTDIETGGDLPEEPIDAGQGRDGWPKWADRFFDALRDTGSVTKAASRVERSREAVYLWRRRSPSFMAAWDEAIEDKNARGMEIIRRRATEGWQEPIVSKGEVVGLRWTYDKTAAALLLKHALEKEKRSAQGQGKAPSAEEIAEAMDDVKKQMMKTVPASPDDAPKPGRIVRPEEDAT